MLTQLQRLSPFLRKDGWILLAVIALGSLCLLLGSAENASVALTEEEARLSRILSALDGAGRVEVAVFRSASDADEAVPCGVVVAAEGAGDAAVQLRLSRAISTLLNIDAEQIDIFKLKEDE